ncbi:MAG: type II secretion system F family protein [Chloroflexi bacterium]|nr:type II secretion system F family protein [Chloroflexota bacterium]
MPTFLIIAGGAILLLLIVGIVVSVMGRQSLVDERLSHFVDDSFQEDIRPVEKSSILTDWVNIQVERSKWGDTLSQKLAQADVKLKPGEYLALLVIAIFGMGFIAWFLGGREPFSALIGAVVGAFLPRFYVNRQKRKRLEKFSNQLPDMLGLMVNGLRAGFSTVQAMESVSKEMPSPLSDEFRRLVQEMQLGISMDAAMANMLRRIPSTDLDLIVTAITVQREVGGNLAEILDTIGHTIRERIRIVGLIDVLTSQVMYSGRFLALMPLILAGLLWFLNRSYMMSLFNPSTIYCGISVIVLAVIMVSTGYFVMTRIADIEV